MPWETRRSSRVRRGGIEEGASMWARIMTPCLSRGSRWNSPGPPASLPPFGCSARREPEMRRRSASVRSVITVPLQEVTARPSDTKRAPAGFLPFFLQEVLEEVGDAIARLGGDLVLGAVVHAHAVLDPQDLVHRDRVVERHPAGRLVLGAAGDEEGPRGDEGVEFVEVHALLRHLLVGADAAVLLRQD